MVMPSKSITISERCSREIENVISGLDSKHWLVMGASLWGTDVKFVPQSFRKRAGAMPGMAIIRKQSFSYERRCNERR